MIRADWVDILSAWSAIELDLQEQGIDVGSGILRERPWRWLELRIVGLISSPTSRLYRRLTSEPS